MVGGEFSSRGPSARQRSPDMRSDELLHYRPLVVLLGPTAVGKSRVATQVAKYLETDVLTADSRQVYRGMDIGTDKPTAEDRQGVPHRLIDLADPHETFNAGWYRRIAMGEIERLYRAGRLPFVVGIVYTDIGEGIMSSAPSRPACEGAPQEIQRHLGARRAPCRADAC
jgi:hypothetical protein